MEGIISRVGIMPFKTDNIPGSSSSSPGKVGGLSVTLIGSNELWQVSGTLIPQEEEEPEEAVDREVEELRGGRLHESALRAAMVGYSGGSDLHRGAIGYELKDVFIALLIFEVAKSTAFAEEVSTVTKSQELPIFPPNSDILSGAGAKVLGQHESSIQIVNLGISRAQDSNIHESPQISSTAEVVESRPIGLAQFAGGEVAHITAAPTTTTQTTTITGLQVHGSNLHGLQDQILSLDLGYTAVGAAIFLESAVFILSNIPSFVTLFLGDSTTPLVADNGSYAISSTQISTLHFVSPEFYNGTFTYSVVVIGQFSDGTVLSSDPAAFSVTVDPVPIAPTITTSNITTTAGIPFNFTNQLSATSPNEIGLSPFGTEVLTAALHGLPQGSILYYADNLGAGITPDANGNWAVDLSKVSELRFIPPAHFATTDPIPVTLIVVGTQPGGSFATSSSEFFLTVLPLADFPSFSNVFIGPATEDNFLASSMHFTIVPNNTHTQEFISAVELKGVTQGFTSWALNLTTGQYDLLTRDSNGDYNLLPYVSVDAQTGQGLVHLLIGAPYDFVGTTSGIHVDATVTAAAGVNSDSKTITLPIDFTATNFVNPPILGLTSEAIGHQGGQILLPFTITAVDLSDPETLSSLVLYGIPINSVISVEDKDGNGAIFSQIVTNGYIDLTNTWTSGKNVFIQIPSDFISNVSLVLAAINEETSVGSFSTTTSMAIPVTVLPVATPPVYSNIQIGDATEDNFLTSSISLNISTVSPASNEFVEATFLNGVPSSFTAKALDPITNNYVTLLPSSSIDISHYVASDGSLNLQITAPIGFTTTSVGAFTSGIYISSTAEAIILQNSDFATSSQDINFFVHQFVDPPILSLISNPLGKEGGLTQIPFTISPMDISDPEALNSLVISGIPAGSMILVGPGSGLLTPFSVFGGIFDLLHTGNWTPGSQVFIQTPSELLGTFNLTLTAVNWEPSLGVLSPPTNLLIPVTLQPVADAPTISNIHIVNGTNPAGDITSDIRFTTIPVDTDGSETISSVMLIGLLSNEIVMAENPITHLFSMIFPNNGNCDLTAFRDSITGVVHFTITEQGVQSGIVPGFTVASTTQAHSGIYDDFTTTQQFLDPSTGVVVAPPFLTTSSVVGGETSPFHHSLILIPFTVSFDTSTEQLASLILSNIPNTSPVPGGLGAIIYIQNPGDLAPVPHSVSGTTFNLLANGWTSASKVFLEPPTDYESSTNLILSATTQDSLLHVLSSTTTAPISLTVTPDLGPPVYSNVSETAAIEKGFTSTITFTTTILDADEVFSSIFLRGIPQADFIVKVFDPVTNSYIQAPLLADGSTYEANLTAIRTAIIGAQGSATLMLQVTVPATFAGTTNGLTDYLHGKTTGIYVDTTGSEGFSTDQSVNFEVDHVVIPPSLQAVPTSGNEDSRILLTVSAVVVDILHKTIPDVVNSFIMSNIPFGSTVFIRPFLGTAVPYVVDTGTFDLLSHGWVPGSSVLFQAPSNFSGLINLSLSATSIDTVVPLVSPVVTKILPVTVLPVADPPTITNISALKFGLVSSVSFTTAVTDTDGSETISSILLKGLTTDFTVQALDPTTNQYITVFQNSSGAYDLTFAKNIFGTVQLLITQPSTFVGNANLLVQVTAMDVSGTHTSFATTSTNIIDPAGLEDKLIPLEFSSDILQPNTSLEQLGSLVLTGLPTGEHVWLLNPGDMTPVEYTMTGTSFDLLGHGWTMNSQIFISSEYHSDFDVTITATMVTASGQTTDPITLVFPTHIIPDLAPATLAISDSTLSHISWGEFANLSSGTFANLTDTDGSETIISFSISTAGALPAGIKDWSQIEFKVTAVEQNGTLETLVGTYDSQTHQWVFHLPTDGSVISLENLQISFANGFEGNLGQFETSLIYSEPSASLSLTLTDSFNVSVESTAAVISPTITTQDLNLQYTDGIPVNLSQNTITMSETDSSITHDLVIQLSHLPAGFTLYYEDGSVISPVAAVNGVWSFSYEDLENNKIFIMPPDHSHQQVDAQVTVSVWGEGKGGYYEMATSDSHLLHINFESTDTSGQMGSIDVPGVGIGAHPFEAIDHLTGIGNSDMVQISGLLPGTSFYNFGEDGKLHEIGVVDNMAKILLSGEQVKDLYFDSPLELGKIDVNVQILDSHTDQQNEEYNSHSYAFTLDLGTNHSIAGHHASDDPTQTHIVTLPVGENDLVKTDTTITYHVNELGYIEAIVHHPLNQEADSSSNDKDQHHNTPHSTESLVNDHHNPIDQSSSEPPVQTTSHTEQISIAVDHSSHHI